MKIHPSLAIMKSTRKKGRLAQLNKSNHRATKNSSERYQYMINADADSKISRTQSGVNATIDVIRRQQ